MNNNYNIEDFRKELYSTVDNAINRALTQLDLNTNTKGKTVEQMLAQNPIQSPKDHILNSVNDQKQKTLGGEHCDPSFDLQGVPEMNVDLQEPVDVAKLHITGVKRLFPTPTPKVDPVKEATTELTEAVTKYVNSVMDIYANKVTTELKKVIVDQLHQQSFINTFSQSKPKPTKEERVEQLVLGGIQQTKAFHDAMERVKQIKPGFEQPDPSLKEDDSHLEKATDSEIRLFNRRAEAKRRIDNAKTMQEVYDVIDDFVYDDPTPSEYHDVTGENA